MRSRPIVRLLLGIPWMVLAVSCGGEGASPGEGGSGMASGRAGSDVGAAVPVEEWRLTDDPLVEIGVREGEEAYQLDRVRGAVFLEDGTVVVLNGGSQELRYFDAQGRFQRSVGGEGEGPGEFRRPEALRRSADGGLQVWDGSLMRVTLFDSQGTFRKSARLLASAQELFPGDDWIQGGDWVVAPVPPGARKPIRRAVEALPPSDTAGTLRLVQVTAQGRLWVPRVRPPADTPVPWDVYNLEGVRVATVETPRRFRPFEIAEDHVAGLFLDEVDVNYVRIYGLRKPPGSPAGPGLSLDGEPGSEPEASPRPQPPKEVLAEIRSLIKNMASLQEIHYAEHYTYTRDTKVLFSNARLRPPDELAVDILFAGTDGWAGMVTGRETGARCVLAYGYFVPMGWQPGAVICL